MSDVSRKLLLGLRVAVSMVGLATSTLAADLGGNCCADLEERIAELENTTARKGNRKVSLTVTGWVNESIFFWDDGKEQNAYIGTNDLEQSRAQFKGEAKITPDVTAGYRLEIGIWTDSAKEFWQGGTVFPANPGQQQQWNSLIVRQSNWYLSSKTYGKFTLGLTGTATYHLMDDLDTTSTRNVSDYEAPGAYIGSFLVRSNGKFLKADGAPTSDLLVTNVRWTQIMNGYNKSSPGQGGRRHVLRYDTPELMGFIATVAWGEDDLFDGALKYVNKFGDFSLNAAAGYGRSTQKTKDPFPPTGEYPSRSCGPQSALQDVNGLGQGDFCQWWSAGGLLKHEPTGLYAYGAYGAQQVDLVPNGTTVGKTKGLPGSEFSSTAYIQLGVEKKWFSLGKTNFFGEYRHDDVGQSSRGQSSSLNFWAAGIAQYLENADMMLYTMFRQYDGEFTTNTKLSGSYETHELDRFYQVVTGAKLNF